MKNIKGEDWVMIVLAGGYFLFMSVVVVSAIWSGK